MPDEKLNGDAQLNGDAKLNGVTQELTNATTPAKTTPAENIVTKDTYGDVEITDDMMFSIIMQNQAICIELLEYLLPGIKIGHLKYYIQDDLANVKAADGGENADSGMSANVPVEQVTPATPNTSLAASPNTSGITVVTQKTMYGYYGQRGVRLDVFLDDGQHVFNVEMQTADEKALEKRTRALHAHMDISQLKRGAEFDQLRPSYVIFICTFDPFGDSLYRYTFVKTCRENKGRALDDGAYTLFFNTAGTETGDGSDIPKRLKELLAYMNDPKSYPVETTKNDLIRKIDAAVKETRQSNEWKGARMVYEMKMRSRELAAEERKAIVIAENLLRAGMTVEFVAKNTELPIQRVEAIKEQMLSKTT